ncbi:putative cinnamoyl-CoA reductase [Umbelopsis sp. PMI_123]|nr:putative cinnamoyl-CoA reductase [Umbelopsis sp. PMI_123]
MVSSIPSGARVLVTGVTGYIGTHVADQFLKAGYTVVGTSRTAAKAQKVKNYFDEKYAGKFEVYETGDLAKDGVFDNAVKDVDAIAHVASPVVFNSDDPIRDVINLAVSSTLSLLNSALRYGKNVKHVVVTSSVAALLNSKVGPDHVYSEADWNDAAFQTVLQDKENGRPIDGFLAYVASKNEAERAIWRFKEEHKPSFAISTILPAMVYGAILPPPKSVKDIEASSTAQQIVQLYTGENKDPTQTLGPPIFVDVVNVAAAHVRAVERPDKSNGQRYMLSGGTYNFQAVADILREQFPERQNIIAKGEPGKPVVDSKKFDSSKAVRELGIEYTDLKTVISNTVDSFKHFYA